MKEQQCNMGYLHPVVHKYVAHYYWVPAIHGGYWAQKCKKCGRERRLSCHMNWDRND